MATDLKAFSHESASISTRSIEMNDPQVTQMMTSVRKWLEMNTAEAKNAIKTYMDNDRGFQLLDYEFLDLSETTEEAIGLIFGV